MLTWPPFTLYDGVTGVTPWSRTAATRAPV